MRSQRTRQGFTLYELLVAMTIGSVILMSSTMLIGHAFRWTTQSSHRQQDDQTMFRLSKQFRNDVRESTDAVVSKGDASGHALQLSFENDSAVNYTITESGVQRVLNQPDNNSLTPRESYLWKRPRETSFKINSNTGQVVLTVNTPSKFVNSTNTRNQETTAPWRLIHATTSLRLKHKRGEIQP